MIVKEYLETVAFISVHSIESVVLKHGQRFAPPQVARPKGIRKGKDHQCYRNAYYLAMEHDLQYVEGFAGFYVPMEHAWVIDEAGNVIETTWKTPGVDYYGIVLPMPFVNRVLVETGMYCVLNKNSKEFRKKYLGDIK